MVSMTYNGSMPSNSVIIAQMRLWMRFHTLKIRDKAKTDLVATLCQEIISCQPNMQVPHPQIFKETIWRLQKSHSKHLQNWRREMPRLKVFKWFLSKIHRLSWGLTKQSTFSQMQRNCSSWSSSTRGMGSLTGNSSKLAISRNLLKTRREKSNSS